MSSPLDRFLLFPEFPVEIRLKIWSLACDNEPRTFDIWTDFKHCKVDNMSLYTQFYECILAKRALALPSMF